MEDKAKKAVKRAKNTFYSPEEELANSLTHGLGLILALIGTMNLVVQATLHGSTLSLVCVNIFGGSLIFLFASSTVYHAVPVPRMKVVCRIVDHAAIYILIAGTYTPVTLSMLPPVWGWTLFGIIWGLAAVGVIYKLFFTGRFDKLSTMVYVGMGWLAIIAIKPMLENFPLGALILIAAGGLCYTAGVLFYRWESLKYHHAIWHIFVLGGAACHYFVVALYSIR
ncbi:MAG: hemolysin III family protein [Bacteroidia bacterium]|nr:hemolysin III family protein [Bacteroidia bacterium]